MIGKVLHGTNVTRLIRYLYGLGQPRATGRSRDWAGSP
jgi:hypothetical protein